MEAEREFWLKGPESLSRFLEGMAAAQDERLLHQGDCDKKITERWVIDEAEARGVIPMKWLGVYDPCMRRGTSASTATSSATSTTHSRRSLCSTTPMQLNKHGLR